MTDKDIIKELISNYDLLFTNYTTNKEQLRENGGRKGRQQLLTTLVDLEHTLELAVLEETLKKDRPNSVAVDNSQDIQELRVLRDMIFKSKDVPIDDNTHFHFNVHTFENGNKQIFYLYKKTDDLYYKKVKIGFDLKETVVKDLTSLNTIMKEHELNAYDINNILDFLKEYVNVKNIQPETSITDRVQKRVSGFFSNILNKPVAKGGKRIAAHAASAYKSTGDKVHLFIDNKKLHRSIYVKGNGKAKYCKINNEFVLLSKLKNKIIE
jgi:hypothetical protein